MTKVFAHRGFSSQYPENTMEAFQQAIRVGADGIENDLQMTKDGVVVVIHDENLKRLTGNEVYVKDLSYSELKAMDVGGKFRGEHAPVCAPALDEYLELLSPTKLITNFELKTSYFEYPGMLEQTVEKIRAKGYEDRCIFSSFNHYTLLDCLKAAPEIPRGILYGDRLVDPEKYALYLHAQYLHPLYLYLSDENLAVYKAAGVLVNPWTVDDPAVMKWLMTKDAVLAVISNKPDLALQVRAGL